MDSDKLIKLFWPVILADASKVKTPRYIQNYGYDYKFSGVKHQSVPAPEIL